MTSPVTESSVDSQEIHMDPKLGAKIQAKSIQMMTFILALAIFTIGAIAKLFNDLGLLHSWMVYVPLALGVAVGYFGQRWNERRIARIYDDGTRGVIEDVREYVSRTYGITLNKDIRLETVRVGELEKIRINPLSLPATNRKTGEDIQVSLKFNHDHSAVLVKVLTNNEWFAEVDSGADSILF